jgi:hypothetical protein
VFCPSRLRACSDRATPRPSLRRPCHPATTTVTSSPAGLATRDWRSSTAAASSQPASPPVRDELHGGSELPLSWPSLPPIPCRPWLHPCTASAYALHARVNPPERRSAARIPRPRLPTANSLTLREVASWRAFATASGEHPAGRVHDTTMRPSRMPPPLDSTRRARLAAVHGFPIQICHPRRAPYTLTCAAATPARLPPPAAHARQPHRRRRAVTPQVFNYRH